MYRGAPPVANLERVVERMLSRLPTGYFAGFGTVSLRDWESLSKRERIKRKKAGPHKELLGTYFPPTAQDPAYIHLFIDTIFAGLPKTFSRIPPVRDILLGKVLYHELGHHLHRVIRPEHRDAELVAEEWRKRLLGEYFRREYWYLLPLFWPVAIWARRRKRRRGRA